ncbi:transporter substrate-binding domain-containing protein [Aquimarina mytili]|uniref:histidine kinase n=1 Tax=Aquimarina mytili TaxID=874423 RepID=A0A937D8U2_9FLAO|nr:transporter substrate-binding domain-containing protein [Aquimarina mytili]
MLFSLLHTSCSDKEILTTKEREWLKQNDNITIAFFPYYPPYEFINDNNTIEGIFIEYIKLIEDKIHHKFKRKYYFQWPKLIEDLKNERVDIVLQMQSTKDRDSYLNFYAEYFESPNVIVTRKDSKYSTISSLADKTIVVPKDYAIFENLKREYPNHNFIEDENDLICLQKLYSGVYDAHIGPKAVVNYLIKTEELNDLQITSTINHAYKPGIAVLKKNKILNDIIHKATRNISNQETQSIIENWLYKKTIPFYKNPNFIIPITIIILIGFFTTILIHFYLGFIVKQRTKELKIAKDIIEKDNQLKMAFISNVSQEIKTPLDGILSFSELLTAPKLKTLEKTKYINSIIHSGKQLVDSIDNILEISQLQTKQVELDEEETDLKETLETIHSVFEISARKNGILLIFHDNLKDNERFVIIDKSKFIKIINGIIDNAIKFTKKGAVLVSYIVQNQSLIVSIRDSGVGIDTSTTENIFKSFTKAENQISQKYGGLGLGLSIAKENTILMGGKLSFSSIPNEGSTFRIELPFHPIERPADIVWDELKNLKDNQYVVLIVEDGEVNFLFLKMLLKKIKTCDFIVYRAKNGKEAVQFCSKNQKIDLVFMDIKMPEMNGYEATKIIKKIRPELPIIAQTAYSTKEDIKKALEAGCKGFISKPIQYKHLKKVLRKYFLTTMIEK